MERVFTPSRRSFSARSIFMFVLTVFITALLWVTFANTATTHAEGPAVWNGENILYNGHPYYAANTSTGNESHGLPAGTQVYVYVRLISERPLEQKAHIISFKPGTDPPKATSAELTSYDYSKNKTFSNPAGQRSIIITPDGSQGDQSSCTVTGGLGWIICPLTVTLAGAMDNIFNFVAQFLEVQPPTVDNTKSDLYTAWNVMRSIANVAFIVVFLIIIYSQLTNAGITNYGLKKLLPRLIIAAILVNVSYIICALALDISNILGYSLQNIFNIIRKDTFNITDDTWASQADMTWQALTAAVLSGGALSVGALAATGGTFAAAVYLLVPLLVGFVTTVLVVLLILAARQAIIIILIVLAPLAFVAYLLPNTEQLFKRWRDLFMTMLVFFPAFSLVFGGAQLAGGIIIQNATSIITVIFGLAVQVAPLVITPLLLKLSGSLLGRIAGMVNDPRKGLMDRTKNWSGNRAEMHRQRGIGGDLGKKNVFRRAARHMAYSDRDVENKTNRWKAGFEEYGTYRDNTTKTGQQTQIDTAMSKLAAEEMHHDLDQAVQELRAGDESGLRRLRMHADVTTTERITAKISGTTVDEMRTRHYEIERDADGNVLLNTEGRRAGRPVTNTAFSKYALRTAERAVELDQSSRVIASATNAAQNMQIQQFAAQMENDDSLQVVAGGIDRERGAQRALANALAAQSKAHSEAISNAASILTHFNYGDNVITDIALNQMNDHPNVRVNITDDIREAAIAKIAGGANTVEIMKLMTELEINPSAQNLDFRQTFADTLLTNSNKPKFAGAGILANAKQGINIPPPGKARLDSFIAQTINANKLGSAEVLVNQDRDYLGAVLATIRNNESGVGLTSEAKRVMKESIELAKSNELFSSKIGERKQVLDDIEAELGRRP